MTKFIDLAIQGFYPCFLISSFVKGVSISNSSYVPKEDRIKMLLERLPRPGAPPPLLEIDLIEDGQTHLIYRGNGFPDTIGGRGGYGNPHFKSPLISGPGIAGKIPHIVY